MSHDEYNFKCFNIKAEPRVVPRAEFSFGTFFNPEREQVNKKASFLNPVFYRIKKYTFFVFKLCGS